jgi:hypothetical protein
MSISLTMRAGGHAWLTIGNRVEIDDYDHSDEKDISVSFHLSPDEKGWENAEDIASALQEWAKHTKRISDGLKEYNE